MAPHSTSVTIIVSRIAEAVRVTTRDVAIAIGERRVAKTVGVAPDSAAIRCRTLRVAETISMAICLCESWRRDSQYCKHDRDDARQNFHAALRLD